MRAQCFGCGLVSEAVDFAQHRSSVANHLMESQLRPSLCFLHSRHAGGPHPLFRVVSKVTHGLGGGKHGEKQENSPRWFLYGGQLFN